MMTAEPNWSALERAYEYRIERERNRQAEDKVMHDLDDPYAWDDDGGGLDERRDGPKSE